MFWPPRPLSFGSAYVYDDYDVEGDMLAFPQLCEYLFRHVSALPLAAPLRPAWSIWRLPRVGWQARGQAASPAYRPAPLPRSRAREAISYH